MTRAIKPKPGTPPAPTIPAIPKPDVPARLAARPNMQIGELKAEWRRLFGTEPPPYNRRFLESRLSYRIQELAYGGLKRETLERLEAVTDEADLVEVYETERHLLYVACTRARDSLWVSGVPPESEFLRDVLG